MTDTARTVRSLVPARIDRLSWSPFHTRMVIALGIAWVLDGLEITVASAVGPILQRADTLHLDSYQVGLTATVYLIGQVTGSLVFGDLSDRLGRRRLFLVTLGLYLAASGLTALSWDFWILLVLRFVAGLGIGGEYAAINSAIDEMIPARYRGRTDLAVNGTYWLGSIIGTLGTYVLLDPDLLASDVGWRIGFLIGPLIALAVWPLRRRIPESPRWLLLHGREKEAEDAVAEMEDGARALTPVDPARAIEIRAQARTPLTTVARTLFRDYPTRSLLGATLMISQSFLYNAIFFTYALVLTHFYDVPDHQTPKYLFAFAVGNLLGPLLLGRFFDTIGRKQMISGTYLVSGVLLAVSGFLFDAGVLTATTQTVLWVIVFFIASAAASSAYLTVSEIFPLEVRARAISLFFAIGQLVGAAGPTVFAALIGDQAHPDPTRLLYGYLFAAAIMITAGLLEAFIGVKAEGTPLEEVAAPLSRVSGGTRA
jgi:MFS family permease